MTANVYRVPKRQWRKWAEVERAVFNGVLGSVRDGWDVLFPASMQSVPRQARRVAAWNTAWIAADALRGQRKAACGASA
jgi:hypothetical protein